MQNKNIEQLIDKIRQRREARAHWKPMQQAAEAVLQKVIQLQQKVAREFPDFKPAATASTQQ